ncbi:hypothetical protein CHS0354_003241 [Potamilus streckersoni]|uniref:ODAD1 central coiled coil region domain-containing protein n=1 Tax=Potamilus streckersoni TaxID=2493646 RepID=A0AAE0RZ40_9BIVA|nr:hypothetical protein CHS0354_003241 [Potamilus streckersoni]
MLKNYFKHGGGGAAGNPNAGGPAGKRSGEEPQDEAQLREDLRCLERKLQIMEGDKRAYAEESGNLLKKQQAEIDSLMRENEEITTFLKLTKNETNELKNNEEIIILKSLTEKLDYFNKQTEEENKQIAELETKILKAEEENNEARKILNTKDEEESILNVEKRLWIMENRLDQSLIKFSEQLAKNKALREEIDHLRRDKAVFDSLYRKLNKNLEETKKQISTFIQEATQAYEERDEAQIKMLALKDRCDKDKALFGTEMKELQRIIHHDNLLKEFMSIKANDRNEFKDEENAKKKRVSGDRDSDADKQTIKALEDAFERIKEITGKNDLSMIVQDFLRKEDENFALYNYINEITDEVDALQEEINSHNKKIKLLEDDDVKHKKARLKHLKEMEIKGEKLSQEADEAEKKNVEICKVLDQILEGVAALFREINCDAVTIRDMLGAEEGVTKNNILQYMGLIEQKTLELMQIRHYLLMKKQPPSVQEKKDNKQQQMSTAGRQEQHKYGVQHPTISIIPPSTQEDEEQIMEMVHQDLDTRPVTAGELRTMIMKNIPRYMAYQQQKSKKHQVEKQRSKSPTH